MTGETNLSALGTNEKLIVSSKKKSPHETPRRIEKVINEALTMKFSTYVKPKTHTLL